MTFFVYFDLIIKNNIASFLVVLIIGQIVYFTNLESMGIAIAIFNQPGRFQGGMKIKPRYALKMRQNKFYY